MLGAARLDAAHRGRPFSHGQRALAAGDLGSALALGAYGEVKDLAEAERC